MDRIPDQNTSVMEKLTSSSKPLSLLFWPMYVFIRLTHLPSFGPIPRVTAGRFQPTYHSPVCPCRNITNAVQVPNRLYVVLQNDRLTNAQAVFLGSCGRLVPDVSQQRN